MFFADIFFCWCIHSQVTLALFYGCNYRKSLYRTSEFSFLPLVRLANPCCLDILAVEIIPSSGFFELLN